MYGTGRRGGDVRTKVMLYSLPSWELIISGLYKVVVVAVVVAVAAAAVVVVVVVRRRRILI